MIFQNPKERVVLFEYGKNTPAVDSGVKSARRSRQHLSATLSPKKLPGSALLPSVVHAPAVYASQPAEIEKFSSVHYLATAEVCGMIAVCV